MEWKMLECFTHKCVILISVCTYTNICMHVLDFTEIVFIRVDHSIEKVKVTYLFM